MKTSNKILLITLSLILLFVAGMIIVSRFAIDPEYAEKSAENHWSDSELTNYVLKDFTEVSVSGNWDVTILSNDTFKVRIYSPKETKDRLSVTKRGSLLQLNSSGNFHQRRDQFKAEIHMPNLSKIQSEMTSTIRFDGFKSRKLDLKIDGAGWITGSNNIIENLELSTEGASQIDLKFSTVKNARLDMNGAGKVRLNMAGGKLTGSANGAGSIVYSGSVSEQDVQTNGAVSIRKR